MTKDISGESSKSLYNKSIKNFTVDSAKPHSQWYADISHAQFLNNIMGIWPGLVNQLVYARSSLFKQSLSCHPVFLLIKP